MAKEKRKRVELSDDLLEEVNAGIDVHGIVEGYVKRVEDHAKSVVLGSVPIDLDKASTIVKSVLPTETPVEESVTKVVDWVKGELS